MKRLTALIALLLLVPAVSVLATPPTFITFCHVAGLAEDPANTITLTLPEQAVFGQAGHFNENGTPKAGHEQDYLGECEPDTTSTTVPVTTTTVLVTTTTVPVTTTTQSTFTEQTTTTVVECPPGTIHQPPFCVAPTTAAPPKVGTSSTEVSLPEELPFTGASIGMLVLSAGAFLLLGLGALRLGKRIV